MFVCFTWDKDGLIWGLYTFFVNHLMWKNGGGMEPEISKNFVWSGSKTRLNAKIPYPHLSNFKIYKMFPLCLEFEAFNIIMTIWIMWWHPHYYLLICLVKWIVLNINALKCTNKIPTSSNKEWFSFKNSVFNHAWNWNNQRLILQPFFFKLEYNTDNYVPTCCKHRSSFGNKLIESKSSIHWIVWVFGVK